MPPSKKRRTDDGPDLTPIHGQLQNGHGPLSAMQQQAADNRRKKSAASRIGRACDRCQHRKLACDPAPEGCPPCQKVNAWCTVTDPLTGTPTYRGEFEYLETKVAKQQSEIEELLNRLRQLGHEPSDCGQDETGEDKRYRAWTQVKAAGDTRPWDRDERNSAFRRNGPPNVSRNDDAMFQERKDSTDSGSKQSSVGPEMPEPLAPESYVGLVSSRGHPVSSRLNMFGWEIDLADFTPQDADYHEHPPDANNPVYDRSYRGSYASIYGLQPRLSEPDLPPKTTFMHYAEAIIGVLNPYTPVLNKAKFLEMIDQVYDHPETPPTPVQKAIMHMTCANIMMHMAARNQDQSKSQLDKLANHHYHYVLGFFGKLLAGDTIEHVQALTMVCLFTRNFPKPEMCWAISNRIFTRLIELSYHRTPRKKLRDGNSLSIYETEMQKRLFWVILICAVNTSGKLGRPMPLRVDDFDIEVPSSIADDALADATNLTDRMRQMPCDFKPHIELCKLTPIYMEVYSTIYTAKRSKQDYRAFIDNIETKLKRWQEQWPAEYQDPSKANDLDKMSMSFLNFFISELKLLLHHPSLSMAKGGHPNPEDLKICLSVSHGMLQNVKEMQRLRALEGTWHNCSIFMLAIQTTLYGHKMLNTEMTAKKLEELRTDMVAWLSITRDMGVLLGSGEKLQRSIAGQIQSGLTPLQQQMQARAAAPKQEPQSSRDVKAEPPPTPSTTSSQTPSVSNAAYAGYNAAGPTPSNPGSNAQQSYQQLPSPSYQPQQSYQHVQQQQQQQQQQAPYTYPEPSPTSTGGSYQTSGASMPPSYQNVSNAGYTMGLSAAQQLGHHHQAGPAVNGYSPQAPQHQQQHNASQQAHAFGNGGYYSAYSQSAGDAPTSWLQYTQDLHQSRAGAGLLHSPSLGASNGPGSATDYQPAANALLQLGAGASGLGAPAPRDGGLGDMNGLGAGGGYEGVGLTSAAIQQWPLGFIGGHRNGYEAGRG